MIVDLTEKEEKGSFELKGGGKVHLRLRNDKDEKEINAATLTEVVEYPLLKDLSDPTGKRENYVRFPSEKRDTNLYIEMSWDKNITGWDDLFDCNKKPIPVTKENKILLMRMVPEFGEAVIAGMKILKENEKKKQEELPKNL